MAKYRTKRFGEVTFLNGEEVKKGRSPVFRLRFELENGRQKKVDLPMRMMADPEGGPGFDELVIDLESLDDDQLDFLEAYHAWCSDEFCRREESKLDR